MESINSNFCWAHSALGTRTPIYFKSSLSHNDHPDDRALGHHTPLAPARTSARRVGGARTTSGLGRTGAGADGGDSLRADPPPFLPNGSGRTWKVTSGKVKTRFLGGIMEASSEVDERVSVELASMAHALSLPAESYGNDPDIEMAWAMRAMQHAEVYYKLISSVDPQFLKLTKVDDQIYSEFRENFKELKIDVLDPEELKSESAKEKWRPFCLKFDGIVEDFNYGTLLRLDCSKGYTEENTIFAPRIQFFAIEIARNREGYNKAVYVSVQDKGEEDANRGAEGVSSGGEEAKEEAASGEEKEGDVSRGEEEEEKTDKEGDNEKGAKKEVSRGGEASE